MESVQHVTSFRNAGLILLAMVVSSFLFASPARAVTPAEADAAFGALNQVYWDSSSKFFHKDEQGKENADFWFSAQLWDTVMDQYDRTGREEVKQQIHDVYDGFIGKYPDWTTNKYNDDIMWWAIACTRAFIITKDSRYLEKAKVSFDFVYDNFLDDKMGGGLYWLNERTSKNSCINSPAAIAAVRLSVLLKDDAYLAKGKSLYDWQKRTLTDGNGKVFDSIGYSNRRRRNRVATFSLTYNQGTFVGAAVLLYQQTNDKTYLDDAIMTAQWTKDNLCVTAQKILRSEGTGDGGAFKGIFVRYMKLLINQCGRKEFLPWMKANADSAWKNRRLADDIMGDDWTVSAGNDIQSQSATSAVAALLCFADDAPQD
ncbi:Glycosyl hydrolase family 76 [Planctomycetes bacterium CA13]|uniref:Glycosyl hydrolase family 76 n=1 Tax=Novipirellula herctigrandis TaxID=2527986 RepID=A0A5C5YVA3_9BACT|nr:Glycosyl hydrolase family 76 [Planctomycetes bacterium CA13]